MERQPRGRGNNCRASAASGNGATKRRSRIGGKYNPRTTSRLLPIKIISNKTMTLKNWLNEPITEAIKHVRAGRNLEAIERCEYAIEISGVATKSSAARVVGTWQTGGVVAATDLARAVALITVAKTLINAGAGIELVSAIALLDCARDTAHLYF